MQLGAAVREVTEMNEVRRRRMTAAALGTTLAVGVLAPWGAPAQAAPTPAQLDCWVPMFEREMDYPTTANLTAERSAAGTVRLTLALGAMPGLAPVRLDSAPTSLKVTATVDGRTVTLSGSHTVRNLAPNAPIPMPVVTGTVPSSANSLAVAVTKVDAVSSAMGLDVAVNCTPVSGLTRTVPVTGTVTRPPAPRPPVKVTKVKSATSVKTKVSKKKVAKVTVSVKGSRGTATGKVKVTVKKGKKVVKKSTLTLRKGKASVKTKRLKKGRYAVTVSYVGSSAYKASKRKSTFRVR